jgi:hypothetical protein
VINQKNERKKIKKEKKCEGVDMKKEGKINYFCC